MPGKKGVEVVADALQPLVDQGNDRITGSSRPVVYGLQQGFQRFRQLPDAIQADDGERSLYLMQMSATVLDVRQIGIAGGEAFREDIQGVCGAFQCEIDLALDPAQRAGIEFSLGIHDGMPISIKRSSASKVSTSSCLQ